MDIKREGVAKRKTIRRVTYLFITAAVVALAGWRVSQLKPAAPSVETATVWPDTVKRGPMVRDVRGLGTLVPEETLLIPAPYDSRVDKIFIRPGTMVRPDSVLVQLSNPEMQVAAVDAEYNLKAAE